jgi:hypothetical protein
MDGVWARSSRPLRCHSSKRMTLAYKFQPSAGGFTASSSSIEWGCLPLPAVLYVLSARKSPLQESTRTGSPAAESGESLLEVILVSRIDSHSVPAKGLGAPNRTGSNGNRRQGTDAQKSGFPDNRVRHERPSPHAENLITSTLWRRRSSYE